MLPASEISDVKLNIEDAVLSFFSPFWVLVESHERK